MIRVQLEGIEQLKERFSTKTINEKLRPVMQLAASQLHTKLKNSISQTYFAPYTLDKVLLGNRLGEVRTDRNTVSFDINYRNEPIPLGEFPNTIETVPAKNWAFSQKANGKLRIVPVNKARKLKVKVKRSSGYKVPRAEYNIKGWMLEREGTVFARKQAATWASFSPLTRAAIRPLFGPSLAQMANSRFKDSRAVKEFEKTLMETILTNFEI